MSSPRSRARQTRRTDRVETQSADRVSRRDWMKTAGVAGGIAGAGVLPSLGADPVAPVVEPNYRIKNGRIRQSIMGWTFNPMPTLELATLCKSIGLVAMEGVDSKFYPEIRAMGLEISLVGSHGFAKGPFNPANHGEVETKLREGIDTAVKFGAKRVITFTGMREPGITDEAGSKNCVEAWKRVIPYAEKKGIELCLEHLNSRDSTHPMKGHPGYFGDDLERCIELIRRVDSPNMKVLFDIYHVQIMHGDVIRRLRQYKEYIAHIHTAGVPGRGELDENQEVQYPAIMRAILDIGFTGYVAQEFIPTWPDRAMALRHAAKLCDV